MKIGDIAYTVNNKTGEIDTWKYNGMIRAVDNILCHLTNGSKYCFLPANCVFSTEAEARAVAEKK